MYNLRTNLILTIRYQITVKISQKRENGGIFLGSVWLLSISGVLLTGNDGENIDTKILPLCLLVVIFFGPIINIINIISNFSSIY